MVMSNHLPHLQAAFRENVTPPDPEVEFDAGLRLIVDGLRTRLES